MRRSVRWRQVFVVMVITIARLQKKASQRIFLQRGRELTFSGRRLWSGVQPPANQGKRGIMSGRSPRARDAKKVAQSSPKEKRAEKRASAQSRAFIKPRKGASG